MKGKYNIAGSYKFYKDNLHENLFQKADETGEEVAEEIADAVEAEVEAEEEEMEAEEGEMGATPAPKALSLPPASGAADCDSPQDCAPQDNQFGGGQSMTQHSLSVEFSVSPATDDSLLSQTSFERPEWVVTRVMTDRGERIAMEKQSETDCEILASNLSYEAAEQLSTELSRKLEIPEFDNTSDKYIGKISSKVVRKDKAAGTSYKY